MAQGHTMWLKIPACHYSPEFADKFEESFNVLVVPPKKVCMTSLIVDVGCVGLKGEI